MNNLRKTPSGEISVVASLPERAASGLIKRKRIRIGWTTCKIQEKVEPDFCTNCQNFGHLRFSCKNPTTGGIRCLKCGVIGHIAKNCTGDTKCFSCNNHDHRADSFKCPKYSKLVEEINARKLNSKNA